MNSLDQNIHSEERIAALLFQRVGDSLLATPALRAVKKHLPQSHIDVICERHVARVFEYNPSIDTIIKVNASASLLNLLSSLRRIHPVVTLDFLSNPRSGIACLFSGAQRRIGFAGRGRDWMYSESIERQNPDQPVYSAIHKLRLAAAVGADDCDIATTFHITDNDREFARSAWQMREWSDETRVAAFFVHSRREYKRWPMEKFRSLIQLLGDDLTLQPLLLATPGSEESVEKIRTEAKLPILHEILISDLGHLAAVLERSQVLIGNDGGPKHIAVAVGTPTATIFVHDSPLFWTPANDPSHIALNANASPADVRNAIVSFIAM